SFLESWPPLPFPGLGSLTFLTCRLVISIRKATKKAPTFIRCRNPEWLSVAGAFTSRTVASIVTANRSAPITPLPISIGLATPLQVRPQTPPRNKTPSLPHNHPLRLHLPHRRPRPVLHLRRQTLNKTPSPPRNHLLRLHLLRRRPRPMPRPRRQTPRPNKMLSLPHNH